jgi:hypothetical protein
VFSPLQENLTYTFLVISQSTKASISEKAKAFQAFFSFDALMPVTIPAPKRSNTPKPM